MQDPNTAPPEVRTLAQAEGMTPIDWAIKPDEIVIVYEQGPKKTYSRAKATQMIEEIKPIPSAPSAASTPPILNAPPILSSKLKPLS